MGKTGILFLCFVAILQSNAQETTIKNTTICWDTSYSMFERNLEQEFEVLEKIFDRSPNQNVQLLLFNLDLEEHQLEIRDGDWSQLKEILINTKADGATFYENLEDSIKYNSVYFFTDGKTVLENSLLPVKKGNFIINSVPDRDGKYLEKVALLGRGRLMDLAAILPENISEVKETKDDFKNIKGTVYLDNEPAVDIEIRIKGSDEVFRTDADGKFAISTVPGDSILISSREFRTFQLVPIGYLDKDLDIFLEPSITQLEEVLVLEERITFLPEGVVNTGTGLKSKQGVGYAVQSIEGDDIIPAHTDVSTAVQGKFSGISLGRDQDLTQFRGRSNNTLLGNNYGLVVVDGVPIQQSDSSSGFLGDATFINPDDIEDITVLKGFAATNRYGALGNGGVLLITTKSGSGGKVGGKKNTALVTDNLYDPTSEISTQKSTITKALNEAATIADAYSKYLELKNFNKENPSFFMDCFAFFMERDTKLALKILSNLWELNPQNKEVISLMGLSARALGNNEVAESVNRQMNDLKPLAIQPFFNEAELAKQKGHWQQALEAWSVLSKGGNYGTLDVSPIQKSIEREIKNLIFQKRSLLETSKIDEKYFSNEKMNVRLKLEWSDPKAEFHVQFVNPQNRYFNWEHTSQSDSGRLQEEIKLGYAMEEFEVFVDLKGEWQVNINYFGHLDGNTSIPLVLLCSKYTDFGLPTQKLELIWLYLDAKTPRKNLAKFKI